ncbi:MAG TPA: 3-oxoacyl-ACP reductase family protein [Anaerolineales bacterium]|nr:3-oxoacyl-ACP reductase family protein [Anaerolineales bacterium]
MTAFGGRVALVTGAARGLGRAVAQSLAGRGAVVAANDVTPIDLEPAVASIREAGGTAEAFVADVANSLAVRAMVESIVERFGRIDILVNNAGVEPHAPLLELDEYDWDRTLAVNLKGPFLLTQAVGRRMAEQGGGVIVNMASIAGRAHGLKDRAAYVASKTGLLGLTREAARDLATYNIRVNAVCPGVIETEMTAALRQDPAMMARWLSDIPQGRLGSPDDVVPLVIFLCSDEAAYITGQAFNVDGGKVMC